MSKVVWVKSPNGDIHPFYGKNKKHFKLRPIPYRFYLKKVFFFWVIKFYRKEYYE